MTKTKSKVEIKIYPGVAHKLQAGHKYLLIIKEGGDLSVVGKAIKDFFADTPIFVLAMKDLNDAKIAEIVGEDHE